MIALAWLHIGHSTAAKLTRLKDCFQTEHMVLEAFAAENIGRVYPELGRDEFKRFGGFSTSYSLG